MKPESPTTPEQSGPAVASSDLLADSPTWPHVLAFAKRMEAKLAKNRHKGDRDGWLKDHPWNLVERILDETVEVQQCFNTDGAGTVWLVKTPEATADECADVANFCMMVADRVTAPQSSAERASDSSPATGSASDDTYKRCAEMMQACAKLLQVAGREMDNISDAKDLHQFADRQESLGIEFEEWLNNAGLKDW